MIVVVMIVMVVVIIVIIVVGVMRVVEEIISCFHLLLSCQFDIVTSRLFQQRPLRPPMTTWLSKLLYPAMDNPCGQTGAKSTRSSVPLKVDGFQQG